MDGLTFDARWQHALELTPEAAYLSRRSLVEFRSRLVERDPQMTLVRVVFDRVTAAAVKGLKLSTKEQRLDSTLVASAIFTRGRVELFGKTLEHFLKGLAARWPERVARLSAGLRAWHGRERQGWFGTGGTKEQRRTQLAQLAGWLAEVAATFADDAEVAADERYGLVTRLLAEHCAPVKPGPGGGSGGAGSGDGPGKGPGQVAAETAEPTSVQVLSKPTQPSTSLQSPYDPDAGYGHKGTGYLLHVTETCRNDSTEVITDYDLVGAGEVDRGKSVGVLNRLEERGIAPEVVYVDGGYVTGDALLDAEARGVELCGPATLGRLPPEALGREGFEHDQAGTRIVRCHAGHAPVRHSETLMHGATGRALYAYFNGATCRACPYLAQCIVRAPNSGKPGAYHLEVSPGLLARDQRLAEQRDPAWKKRYAIRAGIEATNAELKKAHGAAKLRVRRRPRVLLALALKLTACNVKRWLRASPGRPSPLDALFDVPLDALAAFLAGLRHFASHCLRPRALVARRQLTEMIDATA